MAIDRAGVIVVLVLFRVLGALEAFGHTLRQERYYPRSMAVTGLLSSLTEVVRFILMHMLHVLQAHQRATLLMMFTKAGLVAARLRVNGSVWAFLLILSRLYQPWQSLAYYSYIQRLSCGIY